MITNEISLKVKALKAQKATKEIISKEKSDCPIVTVFTPASHSHQVLPASNIKSFPSEASFVKVIAPTESAKKIPHMTTYKVLTTTSHVNTDVPSHDDAFKSATFSKKGLKQISSNSTSLKIENFRNYLHSVKTCFESMGKIVVYTDRNGNNQSTFYDFLSPYIYESAPHRYCYLHKQSKSCGGGVYDPKCHTALKIVAGRNFLNQFVYENFKFEQATLWYEISQGFIIPYEYREHFDISPVFAIKKDFMNFKLYSRFCGISLESILKEFYLADTYEDVWAKWKQRKVREQKVPFLRLQIDAITQKMESNLGNTISKNLKRDFQILREFVTRGSFNNLSCIDRHIEYFQKRLGSYSYIDGIEREYAFISILLLKAMYAENILKKYSIDHGHLHLGNLTWEAVDKSVTRVNRTNIKVCNLVSFDREKYLANPNDFNLILRIIDLGRLTSNNAQKNHEIAI